MVTEQDVANFRRLLEQGFSQGDLSVVDEIVSPMSVEHQLAIGAAVGLAAGASLNHPQGA